jgi:hypothetical protein
MVVRLHGGMTDKPTAGFGVWGSNSGFPGIDLGEVEGFKQALPPF